MRWARRAANWSCSPPRIISSTAMRAVSWSATSPASIPFDRERVQLVSLDDAIDELEAGGLARINVSQGHALTRWRNPRIQKRRRLPGVARRMPTCSGSASSGGYEVSSAKGAPTPIAALGRAREVARSPTPSCARSPAMPRALALIASSPTPTPVAVLELGERIPPLTHSQTGRLTQAAPGGEGGGAAGAPAENAPPAGAAPYSEPRTASKLRQKTRRVGEPRAERPRHPPMRRRPVDRRTFSG